VYGILYVLGVAKCLVLSLFAWDSFLSNCIYEN
jgi:hypothetical protein